MMFRNITTREKMLAASTISIALVAVAYNFIIEPIVGQWNGLDRRIRDKEVTLKKHSRILRDKNNIEKMKAESTKYLATKKLTPEEESAIALSRIEKTARDTKVKITNIKPLSYKSFGNYDKFTFRLATESKLTELIKFIYGLQSSDQLLKVERMVLRAKEGDATTIKSILNITKLTVF